MTDVRVLLERHRPRLVYDSHEAYFADSAAIWTDSPTNVLKRAGGTVVARPPQLNLAYLATTTRGQVDRHDRRHHARLRQATPPRCTPRRSTPTASTATPARTPRAGSGCSTGSSTTTTTTSCSARSPAATTRATGSSCSCASTPPRSPRSSCSPSTSRRRGPGRASTQTTPIVYVARGSHANYFSKGSHWTGNWFDQADGKGPQITPALEVLDDRTPAWVLWPGFWGDTKARHPAAGLRQARSAPACARTGWTPQSSRAPRPAQAAPPAPAPPRATARRSAGDASSSLRRAAERHRARRRAAAEGLRRARHHPRHRPRRAKRRARAARGRPRVRRLDERRRRRRSPSEGAKAK